jgi:hypothetical protein
MKKAQAALEFLTTYGWAFLVILVMIGALAYFGVLNPQKYLPEKCMLTTGLDCVDYQIRSTGAVNIQLVNNIGSTISISTFNVSNVPISCGTYNNIASGTNVSITCAGLTVPSVGDKVKFPINIVYTKSGGGYSRMAYGEIFATVQP